MRVLFPSIEPYKTQHLQVSELHKIYIEESGNPKGKPIIYLHGGPGTGSIPEYRCLFDPQFYRIIQFDQRGCGNSLPFGEIKDNDTWKLVSDIEKIRKLLMIESWVVTGGSWGATLALAYAQTHPSSVRGVILRGVFLGRKEDIHWFYQNGASNVFPDLFEQFIAPIPENERDNILKSYYQRLFNLKEESKVTELIRAWSGWEDNTLSIIPKGQSFLSEGQRAISVTRTEIYYFMNDCFFDEKSSLLNNVNKINHLPIKIIHGRYDMICCYKQAFDLKKAIPSAELITLNLSGHSGLEPQIVDAFIHATEEFKRF